MRTKVLLCLAALAAGVASSSAQVYSLNVVGYVNVPFNAGAGGSVALTLVGNPLNNTTANDLNTLINSANIPLFANFFHWNGAGFDTATWTGAAWDNNYSLPPGQAGFLATGTTFTQTFVGEVLQGNLTNHFATGLTLLGSQVPQAGDLNALGLSGSLSLFDNVFLWNFATQAYVTYTFTGGTSWSPSTPSINVADGFFLAAGAAGDWTRTFTVQ